MMGMTFAMDVGPGEGVGRCGADVLAAGDVFGEDVVEGKASGCSLAVSFVGPFVVRRHVFASPDVGKFSRGR